MRYIVPFAIILSTTTIHAETHNEATPVASGSINIQQTTQSVAQRLIIALGLKTISESEKSSIDLKTVVMKALGEGKQMNEIRLATNQAVKDVTGKSLELRPATTTAATAPATLESSVGQVRTVTNGIVANPAETTFDPTTGKMVATLLPGESIFRMAQRVYGKENGRQYLKIYDANRDKIKNINVVVEGLVLVMP